MQLSQPRNSNGCWTEIFSPWPLGCETPVEKNITRNRKSHHLIPSNHMEQELGPEQLNLVRAEPGSPSTEGASNPLSLTQVSLMTPNVYLCISYIPTYFICAYKYPSLNLFCPKESWGFFLKFLSKAPKKKYLRFPPRSGMDLLMQHHQPWNSQSSALVINGEPSGNSGNANWAHELPQRLLNEDIQFYLS